MPFPSALFEELIEDTKVLTRSITSYGERWSTYGDQLGELCSQSQLEELEKVLLEFIYATQNITNPPTQEND